MSDLNFVQYLETLVNSPEYRNLLMTTINEMTNQHQKFQALMELAEFVAPKVKSIDPESEKQSPTITINYLQKAE